MKERPLNPALRIRLVQLNRALEHVLGFEAITAKRDARTGTFTTASAINSKSLRAAWSTYGKRGPTKSGREAFKSQLLDALRAGRAPRK